MESTFESFGLAASLLATASELGFKSPTPIQTAAIPVLVRGKDLIGQARTGSGKTAAFGFPILQHVDLQTRSPQALILCPTRELAAQVARELRTLGRGLAGLSVLELVGGQPGKPQREALGRGIHVAVGTPGRIQDHLDHGSLDVSSLRTVVLDEADRMLDMGFGADVKAILDTMPRGLQTALFSATFPDEIEAISHSYLRNAERVTVEEPEDELAAIEQWQLMVTPQDRFHGLCWVLDRYPHESALVFCNFKASVAALTNQLTHAGIPADRLDGSLDQFHRDQVLARFRNRSVRVLVATDVAGRGIDIEGLDLVVNFELPDQPENYVHRIGRTGRAGNRGVAVSLTEVPHDHRLEAAEARTGHAIGWLDREREGARDLSTLVKSLAAAAHMDTILISGGRKDKVRPGDIVGALTGDAGGLNAADIGKIEVQDRLAYVAVAPRSSRDAVARLNAGRIKGKKFRATLVGGPRGKR